MKNKKGLSELISIILIIGIVIALASFILLWSTNFLKQTTEETSLTAEKAITCTTDVELAISEICYDSKIYISIENKKDRQIDGDFLLIKVEGDKEILLQPTPPGTNLLPFDKKRIELTYFPEVGTIKKISIIPRIKGNNGYIFCTTSIVESSNVKAGC